MDCGELVEIWKCDDLASGGWGVSGIVKGIPVAALSISFVTCLAGKTYSPGTGECRAGYIFR
jgi:hypothetical protein